MIAYRPLRSEASVVSVHAMTANTRLIVLTINQTDLNAKLVITTIVTVTLTDSNDDENTNALTLTHALTIIIIPDTGVDFTKVVRYRIDWNRIKQVI